MKYFCIKSCISNNFVRGKVYEGYPVKDEVFYSGKAPKNLAIFVWLNMIGENKKPMVIIISNEYFVPLEQHRENLINYILEDETFMY